VRPYLATNFMAFLAALAPAGLLLAAHYWWVMKSTVAFEEASIAASQRLAERLANIRANRGQISSKPKKKKRPPFKLKPYGHPAVGLLWKNLIAAGSAFTLRFWLILLAIASFVGFSGSLGHQTLNLSVIAGTFAMIFLGMSFLLGPQFVRQDFRHDLPMADVLKTYPLRGWQVALGEVMAPMVILTALQWVLIVLCMGTSASLGEEAQVPRGLQFGIGAGIALIAPGLNFVSLVVPNAAVLMFPGWFQTGKQGAQGIEATGQRLIFALGQMLVFAVALLPAGIAFAVLFFSSRILVGNAVAVPIGAAAAALIMAVEAGFGVMMLGKLFEKLDLSVETGS
jgi:hypothetical protein